ncbi:hypothetical protein BT69DRAFT_1293619 [Atractiella rhizophila]|nr:hypothetical protein BT69DRAFT_1293619 [Atractiella rhizophila]
MNRFSSTLFTPSGPLEIALKVDSRRKHSFNDCATKFRRSSHGGIKDASSCQSKFRGLVVKFKIYNQLKYKSGWGWNSDCYHPVVPDSVWEEYIEKIRDPWPLWPKMLEMCQDSAATGAAAIDSGAEDSELMEGHSMTVEERDRQLADEWAAASDEEKEQTDVATPAMNNNKKRPADPNTLSAGPPKRIRMTGAMGLASIDESFADFNTLLRAFTDGYIIPDQKPPTPATTLLQEAYNLFRIQDKLFVDFSIVGVFELFREHPAIVEVYLGLKEEEADDDRQEYMSDVCRKFGVTPV